FIAIEGGEEAGGEPTESTGMIAARRRLHLHHVRAKLGKYQPGRRTHHGVAEFENLEAGDRRGGHQAALRRNGSRLPAWMSSLGSWWPTIASAERPTSIRLSRSTPVSTPISSHSRTSSSVQILPAAPFWPAKGQPPSPPTVESKRATPMRSPACA